MKKSYTTLLPQLSLPLKLPLFVHIIYDLYVQNFYQKYAPLSRIAPFFVQVHYFWSNVLNNYLISKLTCFSPNVTTQLPHFLQTYLFLSSPLVSLFLKFTKNTPFFSKINPFLSKIIFFLIKGKPSPYHIYLLLSKYPLSKIDLFHSKRYPFLSKIGST